MPIRADYLSLESLAHLLRWYRDRHASRKASRQQLLGIVLTMVDHRRQATREIVEIIRVHNRRGVFRTEIPEDPRAAKHRRTAFRSSLCALARRHARTPSSTRELLSRIKRPAR